MYPKPLPRAAEKLLKDREARVDDRASKHAIRVYHGFRCCVCLKKGTIEVHEQHRRGAGGVVSLSNSFLACAPPTGACHRLLQVRDIEAEMRDGSPIFDARNPLKFSMGQRIADIVF